MNLAALDAESDVSLILYVDSDIAFDVNHVEALVAAKVPVITGSYEKDGRVVAGRWGNFPGNNKCWLAPGGQGRLSIEWCGTGFLLVQRSVFDQLHKPYFYYPVVPEFSDYASYDIGFSINCTRNGVPIEIDRSVRLDHVKRGE